MSSLLEEVQPDRAEPKPLVAVGPVTTLFASCVGGVHTDLLVTKYSDKTFVCVTQLGKLGTIVQVEKDRVRGGEDIGRVVFSSTVLLGQDSEEIQLLARVLAERSQLNKPLIICVGIKGLTVKLAMELVEFIMQKGGL